MLKNGKARETEIPGQKSCSTVKDVVVQYLLLLRYKKEPMEHPKPNPNVCRG